MGMPGLLRITLFYSVIGSIIWAIAQALGAGIGIQLSGAFLGPPVLHMALLIYRNR